MTDLPQSATHPSRRGFLGRAALVAAAPAAAAILGPTLIPASAAHADAAHRRRPAVIRARSAEFIRSGAEC